ncbi:MAG: D-alanyl-D-alanine carboxypeptidase family protein [Planctomycetaceae bacterium]
MPDWTPCGVRPWVLLLVPASACLLSLTLWSRANEARAERRATSNEGAVRPPAVELPPLKPRDALSGVPFVSCRNWAVADGRTGELLADSGATAAVDVASTTKIMTAFVILRAIQNTPEKLSEKITFSERAAGTEGSSCGLKRGDKLAIRDFLFAMLVPSGNDAAIALAEHFGRRFNPPAKGKTDDPVARFVAEMNREARRLELSATRYLNPNGLPQKGHVSSARDLVRLTVEARKLPLFREIVATRRHEAEATSREGNVRKLSWKTTNRLLAIEGYDGVKTGYTRGAGSCLVSSGQRGGDEVVVVVLGAPSAGAAAADSRNLFRWAWGERRHAE